MKALVYEGPRELNMCEVLEPVLEPEEVLIRHLHTETAAWVDDYRRKAERVEQEV